MPATRSVRRDVILRVPKINAATRRSSMTGQAADGEDKSIHRRSTSPSKRGNLHSEAESSQGTKGEGGTEYKYAAQATSTAEWNSLLIWARRQRGPQWDAATGLWQVDQHSSDYYSFGNDPARHTKLSTFVAQDDAASRANIIKTDEANMLDNDEGEGDGVHHHTSGHHIHGYGIEDSPPIGPGGRRSRMR